MNLGTELTPLMIMKWVILAFVGMVAFALTFGNFVMLDDLRIGRKDLAEIQATTRVQRALGAKLANLQSDLSAAEQRLHILSSSNETERVTAELDRRIGGHSGSRLLRVARGAATDKRPALLPRFPYSAVPYTIEMETTPDSLGPVIIDIESHFPAVRFTRIQARLDSTLDNRERHPSLDPSQPPHIRLTLSAEWLSL